jgi:hypothetical protein
MNPPTSPSPSSGAATVLDRLSESLRGKNAALDGQERPAAILWTDPKGEWRPLVDALQGQLDELLVLGDYRPEARTGPAIWIRCVVDGTLDEPPLPGGRVPVVYLPGVARQELRAGEECRDALRPLVELLYRGALWVQANGSDWTVMAFLGRRGVSPRDLDSQESRRGVSPRDSGSQAAGGRFYSLGLDIARDRATLDALLRALPEVALTPVSQLTGRHLQADDFDRMLAADVMRDLLRWMGNPEGTRAHLGTNGWGAFCNRCREELSFDPETEADVVAGERLGRGEGAWAAVWNRFAESPASYPGIAKLLRRSGAGSELRFDRERWPDLNDEDEEGVRRALGTLPTLGHREACEAIVRLEEVHGGRRGSVWARMGLTPMAGVLEPLVRLAAAVKKSLGGTTPDDVASAYRERGWQADAAAWESLAASSLADEAVVSAAVRHLLGPWLEDSARAFQAAVERVPLPGPGEQPAVEAEEDVCLLFADGLRFDLGQRLAERLEGLGCRVALNQRWAALPTVTATAKPAVTPVAGQVAGAKLGENFAPNLAESGRPADAPTLRAAMEEGGYQIVGADVLDAPMSQPARGWVEVGEIDSLGHKLGARLARQIDEELERLVVRITSLLEVGWKAVRVVTDHGWLLLPDGLPKVDLPKHLTESRWSRCAVITGNATPQVARIPWHWNPEQWFATAPGIACFNNGAEYAHGGVSIQECLIPDLIVERSTEITVAASIRSITWRGLRCFVEAERRGGEVIADLRLERATGPSVVVAAKPVEEDGSVSLVLAGDEHEEAALVLVLLDGTDHILAHRPTRVGSDS